MTPDKQQAEREAFEHEMRGWNLDRLDRGTGDYFDEYVRANWRGWQARATLPQRDEPVAEGKSAAEELLTEIRTALNASGFWHLGMSTVEVIKLLAASSTPPSPEADAKRIDALEAMVREGKLEIAKSLYGSGYEFGHWPKSGPTARVFNGTLRAAIDAELARREGGNP